MKTYKVEVEFTDELLGTASANPELHSDFIASKAPDARSRAQEIAAVGVDEYEGKQMTVFPRDGEGEPFLWDYQVKGYLKEACSMLRRADGTKSAKLKAYKKEIDGLVFVSPREIPLYLPDDEYMGECQRPLRASTAQGERIALAHSETCPEGTECEFEVTLLKDSLAPLLEEWLEYGRLHGMGQWRNSGKGRFECRVTEV